MNMLSEDVTLSVFQLSETWMPVRLEQSTNMYLMIVTFDVSNFDRSSDVRLSQ